MSDNFDFEESNKLFDKDIDAVENAAPAYNKDNFFDNLQEGGNNRFRFSFHFTFRRIPGRSYRQADIETFGKSSLEERNRKYHQKNCNGFPWFGRLSHRFSGQSPLQTERLLPTRLR